MSGLELLGLACNIMQVISFSREVISLCSNVYQGKHPDAELADLAASLQAVSSDVQTGFDTINPKTADEKRLCDIATRCAIAARDLEEEVNFITSRQKQGSLASTLRIAAKTTWRKRRLDRLEKSLKEHERVLDTHLTVRVCKKADAIALRQEEGFDKLGADLQHFASQYALGHQKLRELVRTDLRLSQKESEKVMKAHVTEEVTRSQVALLSHVDSKAELTAEMITQNVHNLNIQMKDNDSCERLLRSLKYPAMNERRNHLTESHEGTFDWVFSQHKLSNDDGDVEGEDWNSEYEGWNSEYEDLDDYEDPPWDNFENWLKSDSNIYWVSGKPGSGKSTFMKFLISNPLTKKALQSWRPDVTIISHFFWKPGSMIQRNIKGLLASLIHQLFTLRQDLLQAILAGSWDLKQKDSDTDWSVKELQLLCLGTVRNYGSSTCMFIDGLDEICDEDGVGVLMEILNTMKMIPGVKICVASRPEQRLKLYLSQVPQLKLHDLTSVDIRHYANQTLRPLWKRRQDLSFTVLDEQILPVLVVKADGVFLWIRLAVQNLISGLENGDSSANLFVRLRDLPTELSRMYFDMWTRLNGNSKVHRESTARLLNLLIAHRELWYSRHRYSIQLTRMIDIMGAIELPVQSRLLVDLQRPSTENLIHSCAQTRELIEVRCIGLVHTYQSKTLRREGHVSEARLKPYVSLAVGFIHRSAYDFLIDTEEGHRILSYDSSSRWEKYSQCIRGRLVAAVIARDEPGVYLMQMIARASHFLHRETTNDLVKICWKLHNRGFIEGNLDGLGRHFLSLSIFPKIEDFLISSINKSPRPSALATQVLRDRLMRDDVELEYNSYFGLLTSLGAVPSLKGPLIGRIFGEANEDGSFFTRTLSSVQLILEKDMEDRWCHGYPDDFNDPPFGEVMQFCQNNDAVLTESSWMVIVVYDGYGGLQRMESIKQAIRFARTAHESREINDNNGNTFECGHLFVELKSFFMLESLHRRQQAYEGKTESSPLVNLLEDPIQGPSCVRLGYFQFKGYNSPDSEGIEGFCRVLNRRNVRGIEQLIKSWLLGETVGYPRKSIREAVEHVYDEVAAGSTAYGRIYGDLRENLADDGFGMCKITREEIDERIRNMQDEDPEAPGHWL